MKIIKKHFTILNIIFFASLAGVVLIALEIIPRWSAFLIAAAYLLFIIFSSLEQSLFLFVRSIPFFIALPLTASFDNFNTWRIVLLLIFIKWFLGRWRQIWEKFRKLKLKNWWRNYYFESLGFILFLLSFVSLFNALDLAAGFKRIIYFLNLAMLYFIAKSLVFEKTDIFKPLMRNIVLGGVLAAFFGFLQQAAAFFVPIDVFQHWWGEMISLGYYGRAWSRITMWGNTWFCYTAGSLKLRMFSVFPDSHSFPLYLLMVLPSFLVVFSQAASFEKLSLNGRNALKRLREFDLFLKEKIKENRRLIDLIIILVLINLALILSGTRGIWLAVIFPLVFLLIFSRRFPKISVLPWLSVLIFILLFTVASLFYALPQFKITGRTASQVFHKRLLSALDLEETSNQGRLIIWQKTLDSLIKHPFIGVGIGNFPSALGQDISLAKAGSSAHNLYLNIAAEMGLASLLVFFLLIFEIFKKAWRILNGSSLLHIKMFVFGFLVFFIWVLGYSLTDAALFDERAFLILMLLFGILSGIAEIKKTNNEQGTANNF